MYHNLLHVVLLLLLTQNARSLRPTTTLLQHHTFSQLQLCRKASASTQMHLLPQSQALNTPHSSFLLALDAYDSEGVPPTLLAFALIAVIATIAVPQLSRTILMKSNTRSLSEEDKLNPPPNPYE